MATNVKDNAVDAQVSAAKRTNSTRNAMRKLGNVRTWKLTQEQREAIAADLVRHAQATAEMLVGIASDGGERPFEF